MCHERSRTRGRGRNLEDIPKESSVVVPPSAHPYTGPYGKDYIALGTYSSIAASPSPYPVIQILITGRLKIG
jgi:hypothetical protein